ncbi:hypothetical protein [Streptomyces melanogenes]|uniref:hypothetical protein n=1 Tax=Streptomyces melanogenes TaxID=67326 RepID=UPI0037A66250
MEWTQLLKDLADAVQERNRQVAALRGVSTRVAELTAQAAMAGAPGAPLARVLADMEPAIEQQRPHVCGPPLVVPPVRPASLPKPAPRLPETRRPSGAVEPRDACYSLSEAFEARILPWKAATVRTYLKRSRERGLPTPGAIWKGQGVPRYSKTDLTAWREAWEKQAGLPNGGRSKYTLPKACELGIVERGYGAARQALSKARAEGVPIPQGEKGSRGVIAYTIAELHDFFGVPEGWDEGQDV